MQIKKNELIRGFVDMEKQLTPNGFDLTVGKIYKFVDNGSIDFSNKNRKIAESNEIMWENGVIELELGVYKIRTNEIIKMPLDLVGIARPRSSLSRSGVAVDTGVWDAGFEGKSEFLLIVGNKSGFRIEKDARIVQLVFFEIESTRAYVGVFKHIK